jgi:CBS domain-containing protein
VTCTINETLKDVVAKLIQHRIHRIFITDDDNTLEGVLSLCDLISVLREPV